MIIKKINSPYNHILMSNEVYINFKKNINGIIYNIKLNLYNSNHIIILK